MDSGWPAALNFVLHLGSTAYMVGLVCFVQWVHYPLFARVGPEAFVAYQRGHLDRTGAVVGPAMLLEAGTGVGLLLWPVPGVPPWAVAAGLGLLAAIWLSTLLLQMPRHRELARRFDATAHRRLVATNWIRTVAWSLRGLLVATMALFVLAGAPRG